MLTVHKFSAWAIDTCSDEGHGLIGKYWKFRLDDIVPIHLEGCRVALFRTRAEARNNLHRVRPAFAKAKVVRVHVDITYQGSTAL